MHGIAYDEEPFIQQKNEFSPALLLSEIQEGDFCCEIPETDLDLPLLL